jgi:hypothetical protein
MSEHPVLGKYSPGFQRLPFADHSYEINEEGKIRNLITGRETILTSRQFVLSTNGKQTTINVPETILTLFFAPPHPNFRVKHINGNSKYNHLHNLTFSDHKKRVQIEAKRKHGNSKQIECLNNDGTVKATYASAKEAVQELSGWTNKTDEDKEKLTEPDGSLIHKAISRSTYALGFRWRYRVSEAEDQLSPSKKKQKTDLSISEFNHRNQYFLELYDNSKNFVSGFDSYKDAAAFLNKKEVDGTAEDIRRELKNQCLTNRENVGEAFGYFLIRKQSSTAPPAVRKPCKPKQVIDEDKELRYVIPGDKFAFLYQFNLITRQCIRTFSSYDEAADFIQVPEASRLLKFATRPNNSGIAFGFYWCRRSRDQDLKKLKDNADVFTVHIT